jgi:poly-gamma-glutamate capsule biosynthesis protein CapA/YwtB (metallophosphatase superfamily)
MNHQTRRSTKIAIVFFLLIVLVATIYLLNTQLNQEENSESLTTVLFLGDFMIGDSYNGLVHHPFESISSLFENKDDVIVNLETAVTNRNQTENIGKTYLYKINETVLNEMNNRNITMVNLANNHALDYGKDGFEDTIQFLNLYNISYFGAGENESNARKGIIKEYTDQTTIGYLGYFEYRPIYDETYHFYAENNESGVAILNLTNLHNDILRLKNETDLVIVSFHIGQNYNPDITKVQQDYAHFAIDYGADAVICHSAHIILPIEWYKETPIFYSIGNSIFTTPGRFRDVDPIYHYGLGVTFIIENREIISIELTPFKTNNRETGYTPSFLSKDELKNIFDLIIPADKSYIIVDSSGRIDL